ncbi:MAG: hypothetical protein DRP88_03965, partial [Candidatus Neomarinimicrobiota bacterium]
PEETCCWVSYGQKEENCGSDVLGEEKYGKEAAYEDEGGSGKAVFCFMFPDHPAEYLEVEIEQGRNKHSGYLGNKHYHRDYSKNNKSCPSFNEKIVY